MKIKSDPYFLKEHFLVPDHTIKDISGASFAGFYYICFQKSTATIEGYYYHRSSEWWVYHKTGNLVNTLGIIFGWMDLINLVLKDATFYFGISDSFWFCLEGGVMYPKTW